MEITQALLIIAIAAILLLLFVLFLPPIRKLFSNVPDDSLEVQVMPHPFGFKGSPDNPIKERIVETVNRMGGTGDNAEAEYRDSLETLRYAAEESVPIIV